MIENRRGATQIFAMKHPTLICHFQGVVVAEVKRWDPDRLVVRLSDETLKLVEEASTKVPGDYLAAGPVLAEPSPPESKVYGWDSFGRNTSGSKAVMDYVTDLPSQYLKYGIEFPAEIEHKGKSYVWKHVVLQAVDYFDVLKPGGSSKEYGKCVLTCLLQLQPQEAGGSPKHVARFCENVAGLAQPLLIC